MEKTAKNMYFFPVVGALIGLLAGAFGWVILHSVPPLVTGVLVTGFIYVLSGFHHLDGLLDFGDALIVCGSPEQRLEAMHDPRIGTGGVMLGSLLLLATASSVAELNVSRIIPTLIVAETLAKFSMIVMAAAGRSARPGVNTYFINAMHGPSGSYRLLVAFSISTILSSLLLRSLGLIMVLTTVVSSLILTSIAHRRLGGVTGDVLGATNEITRTINIVGVLVGAGWA